MIDEDELAMARKFSGGPVGAGEKGRHFFSKIPNMNDSASSHFQILKKELKIQWSTCILKELQGVWKYNKTLSRVFDDVFSNETQTEEKRGKQNHIPNTVTVIIP